MYANQSAFENSDSYRMATGVDLRVSNAIVDLNGNVLAYAQTGGMIAPIQHVMNEGDTIFRFGGKGATARSAAMGGWWIERPQFDRLVSFANFHELYLGLAVRILCLVPPEWSDLSLLVRCRVRRPLLAWRGLGDSVVVPRTGGGTVNLPHQNEIAARRVFQLFVPGMQKLSSDVLAIEREFEFDPRTANQGWIYL